MRKTEDPKHNSEFIIFKTEDEQIAVDVRFEDEILKASLFKRYCQSMTR